MKAALALLAPATWACLLGCCATAHALEDDEAVEFAKQGLRGRNYYPWYDKKTDDIRRVKVKLPNSDAANRDSSWESKAEKIRPKKQNASSGGFWVAFWAWFWWVLNVLVWVALAALLGFIIWFLVRAYLRSEEASVTVRTGAADQFDDDAGDIERIEALPFDVKRPRSNLLAEAQRYYEQGDYGQAIVYLFSYQLVQLDKHDLIRLARGKTNRQYLRELRRQRRLFELLEITMIAFEDVFFGRYTLARERFEICWSGLDEFHDQVGGTAA